MKYIVSAFCIASFSHVTGVKGLSKDDVCVGISSHLYVNLARMSGKEQEGSGPA